MNILRNLIHFPRNRSKKWLHKTEDTATCLSQYFQLSSDVCIIRPGLAGWLFAA